MGLSVDQWQESIQEAWQRLAVSKGVKLAMLPTFNGTGDPPLCSFYGATASGEVGIVPIPCNQAVSLQTLVCQADVGGGIKGSYSKFEELVAFLSWIFVL